jgi:hypothetical protein
MKNRRKLLGFAAFLTVFAFGSAAFAQVTPADPPVSLLTVVVMAATFLVGFFGNSVATDEILGTWKLNPSWVPVFTLGGSFLAGALKILGPAVAAGTTATGSLFVSALYSGLMAMIASGTGTAGHAYLQKVAAVKKAKLAKLAAKAAAPAAAVLALVAVLGTQTACTPATIPTIEAVVQVVETDLTNNVGDAQLASDVCKALGGSTSTDAVCADVPALIVDAIQLLIDSGTLPPNVLANAKSYMLAHKAAVAAPAVSK